MLIRSRTSIPNVLVVEDDWLLREDVVAANDNHRTWLDGIARHHPWRVVVVSLVLTLFVGRVLASALDQLIEAWVALRAPNFRW
jgi:hypothetical protein